jgi:hypothetical protein
VLFPLRAASPSAPPAATTITKLLFRLVHLCAYRVTEPPYPNYPLMGPNIDSFFNRFLVKVSKVENNILKFNHSEEYLSPRCHPHYLLHLLRALFNWERTQLKLLNVWVWAVWFCPLQYPLVYILQFLVKSNAWKTNILVIISS